MGKEIKTKYALEFAKLSYSLEEKRETDILKKCRKINPFVFNRFCYHLL